MNYLNPHKLDFSGGSARLQTSNPVEQLQAQEMATEAFQLLSQATGGTYQPQTRQDLIIGSPDAEESSTYEDLMVM